MTILAALLAVAIELAVVHWFARNSERLIPAKIKRWLLDQNGHR
jgi:hypothetical protein